MDLEQTFPTFHSINTQLRQENDQLKAILNVVKENINLRTKIQSFKDDSLEESTVWPTSAGRKSSSLLQNTCDERQFKRGLQQIRLKDEPQTSSPVDFKSFIQSTAYTDTSESQSCRDDVPLGVRNPERLLGEIAYQLDRRILSHIFQGQKRLYGFTVLNIPNKIIEVSTHPLTGKLDKDYQLHLTERYEFLMERLNQLGYKTMLHPLFAEFIVNTYGILRRRPNDCRNEEMDYNNPEFLRMVITTSAPRRLQKDLLLLLTCLCDMAEKDQKHLLLW